MRFLLFFCILCTSASCQGFEDKKLKLLNIDTGNSWLLENKNDVDFFKGLAQELPSWTFAYYKTHKTDLALLLEIASKSGNSNFEIQLLLEIILNDLTSNLKNPDWITIFDALSKTTNLIIKPKIYDQLSIISQLLRLQKLPIAMRGKENVSLNILSNSERYKDLLLLVSGKGDLEKYLFQYDTDIFDFTCIEEAKYTPSKIITQLYLGKKLLQEGNNALSWKTFKEIELSSLKGNIEGFLKDSYNAARLSGNLTESAQFFAKIAKQLKGKSLVYASELSARLFKSANNYNESLSGFTRTFDEASILYASKNLSEYDFERELWYVLREYGIQTHKNMGKIFGYIKKIKNPSEFDDIFDSFLSSLLSDNDMKSLQDLSNHYAAYMTDETKARLWCIIENYDKAYNQNVSLYHHVIAAIRLSKPILLKSFMVNALEQKELSDEGKTAQSLFAFQNSTQAFRYITENRRKLTNSDFESILGNSDFPLDTSQRAKIREYQRNYFGLLDQKQNLEETYPRPYDNFMKPLDSRVPINLLYGLIRSESFFDEKARSGVGAQGIAQFMPETADDLAKILKRDSYNIYDPETALLFSAVYLERLKKRHLTWVYAIASYNAGTLRIRKEVQAMPHIDALAFADALEIRETRNYIIKVIEASIFYESIYANASDDDLRKFALGLFERMEN